ncbi:MAG: serine/threonine protein kinase, partial [Myxococcaceae bacterium]|nr:serine/threonine protein kinase [Myxococcaceae bacterium]
MTSDYRLLGRLETGELAELFRAEAKGQRAIVKLFHPATSAPAYARAVSETAHRLAASPHPLIAQVIGVGLAKKRLAVIREDLGPHTLGQALQRLYSKDVVLPFALALGWVIELAQVLTHAHRAQVVHGALTPGNVLLTDEGRLGICDFGALAAMNAVPALRKAFGQAGRGAYRPPEGQEASPEADIYSLGVIAYELLTLRLPPAAAMSTRRELPPPPSRLNRRINARLDPIILRALDPVPGRRYQSASELASAVGDFLSAQGGVPGQADRLRMLEELFPPQLKAEASGPVPFERFDLEEVEGAELPEPVVQEPRVSARPAFSGGEVDATAETSMSAPAFEAFGGDSPFDSKEITGWDAPPAQEEPGRRVRDVAAADAQVQKRMKKVDDFSGVLSDPGTSDTQEMPQQKPPQKPRGSSSHAAHVPRGSASHAAHVPRPSPPGPPRPSPVSAPRRPITEELRLEAQRFQRGRRLVVAGAFFFTGALVVVGLFWWRGSNRLPAYRPPPARVLEVKLPVGPAPVALPVVPKPAPPPVLDCYDAP